MVIGMRAAVLFGPGDIRVTERQVPVPGPDEVLLKVAMCGTCGTDLKILDGRLRGRSRPGDLRPERGGAQGHHHQGGYHSMRFAASFLFPPVMLI